MSFLEPGRLLFLVVPLVLAVVYVVMQRGREKYAVRFTNLDLLDKVAPERPGWRRHVPAAAMLAGLVMLTIAVARPATAVQVPRQQATVTMAIDVSLSMEATDVDPTRIDAAREAANAFLDLAPEDLEVGIVAFAGTASSVLTPTTDRQLARLAIDRLTLGEGTAIGEGIFAAVQLMTLQPGADGQETPPSSAAPEDVPAQAIVVLSDGETTMGRADLEAAQTAVDAGIPVWTISFGTAAGEVTIQGERIPVPVNEGALREVAALTGGEFFQAATADELQSILDEIGFRVGLEEEQREVTDWFAGAGLVLALLAAAGSLLWFSRLP